MEYLKLPLQFSDVIKGKKQAKCSFEESIAQHIMIQVLSQYGEVVCRKDFGTEIWELEFNQQLKSYKWEESIKKSIIRSLTKYETRIKNIDVEVKLSEVEFRESRYSAYNQVKKKANIYVYATIIQSGEPFKFHTSLFVSPLSQ
ncbi:GPW/gp25 family protein [Aureivirga marina]|uniref:GPW/gp25 family protein n=1 Tax=Aureivirga marina TaxID=1182451 RepID=UPI0018CBB6E7|nr:GPW/gp25 family protein [Aureivirga marina]